MEDTSAVRRKLPREPRATKRKLGQETTIWNTLKYLKGWTIRYWMLAMQYRYCTCGSILGPLRASILGPLCAPVWGRLCPLLRRFQDYKMGRTKETIKTQGALRSFATSGQGPKISLSARLWKGKEARSHSVTKQLKNAEEIQETCFSRGRTEELKNW